MEVSRALSNLIMSQETDVKVAEVVAEHSLLCGCKDLCWVRKDKLI
jgi:hypothetical protein